MNKRQREIQKLIESVGLSLGAVTEGRNHLKFKVLAKNGASFQLVTAKTPSCHRADLNNRSILRRFAAEQQGRVA